MADDDLAGVINGLVAVPIMFALMMAATNRRVLADSAVIGWPNDDQRKKPDGKPVGDQMGQKARPKDGPDSMSRDIDKDKSQDLNKESKPDQRQQTKQH